MLPQILLDKNVAQCKTNFFNTGLNPVQACLWCSPFSHLPPPNLRRLHLSKSNNRKFIVISISQIIGSCQIDSFMCIESVIASISIFNYQKFIAHRLNFRFKLNYYNRNIIGLNQMGRLKHRMEIFFGRSTKNFTEKKL